MSNRADPASSFRAIVPGPDALSTPTRAIYVGGSGDLTVEDARGQSVTFVGVDGGSILPIVATKVTAATATNLIALF